MYDINYLKPDSLARLLELRSELPNAAVIAGGTDLMVRLRSGKITSHTLIDALIPELVGITENDDAYIVAASTSLTTVSDFFSKLPPPYNMLHEAAESVGSCQTRNLATIAGNICTGNASADMATALLALGASLEVRRAGAERVLPIDNFFIKNRLVSLCANEIVTAIYIPKQNASNIGASFIKIGKRRGHVIAILNTAAMISRNEDGSVLVARLAAGTMANTPVRLYNCEAKLMQLSSEGARLDDMLKAVSAVLPSDVDPRDSKRASKAYRQAVCPVALCRTITEAYGGEK